METTTESTILLIKTKMSPSYFEKHHNDISILMGQRTHRQVLATLAVTDSIYSLLHILVLFFSSTVLWKHAHLYTKPNQALYHTIHSNLESVLRVELGIFLLIAITRQVVDTYEAVYVDQAWMRVEEHRERRKVAFYFLVVNVTVSTFFIFWPWLAGPDIRKQRLCTSTFPANTLLDTTSGTRFRVQRGF